MIVTIHENYHLYYINIDLYIIRCKSKMELIHFQGKQYFQNGFYLSSEKGSNLKGK